MTSHLRIIKLCRTLAATALVASLGCDVLRRPTPIRDIVQKPRQFVEHEVMVRGTVTNAVRLPFLPGLYWIDDGTGQIPVLTEGPAPLSATKLRVIGRVEYVVAVGALPIGLHISEKRREQA